MKIKLIFSSICFCFLLFIGYTVDAEGVKNHKPEEILYPANNDKEIKDSADQFYRALQTQFHYKEYPNATMSIREKVLFKDIDKFVYKMKDGKLEHSYPGSNIKDFYPAPDLNRQVFFLMTVKETEKDFKGQYAVYDAETGNMITAGKSFHLKKEYELKHRNKKND
ncbi:hypothetical protein HMPREF1013_04848 [Bacillus sp. 2_A_57_CT2]|nr:hypothetical protein HMPREF1013_04848 [Bacillus sp. 2_A_57_CT2]